MSNEQDEGLKQAGYTKLDCGCYRHRDGSLIPYMECKNPRHVSSKFKKFVKEAKEI